MLVDHMVVNDEIGNDFSTRIRHAMAEGAITFGLMLRVETTTSDVTFFKLLRRVEQRNGETNSPLAQDHLLRAANDRRLASIDNPDAGWKAVDRIACPVRDRKRSAHGQGLQVLARGQWCISGFRARDIPLAYLQSSQTSAQPWTDQEGRTQRDHSR